MLRNDESCCCVSRFGLTVIVLILACSFHAGPTPATAGPRVAMEKIELWRGATQLRGINICLVNIIPELDGDSFGNGAVGPIFTQADFDELRGLGANLVNISYPGLYTSAPPYRLQRARKVYLDQLLSMIAKADMFAVITFRSGPGRSRMTMHWGEDTATAPGYGWFSRRYYNETLWDNSPTGKKAREAYLDMCAFTAQQYRDHPVVVGYDPLIEPNSNETKTDIYDPERFYPRFAGSSYDWNRFYPAIVREIRRMDRRTPILIQPLNYGAVEWIGALTVINDAGIVFCIHPYGPWPYTHQEEPSVTYPGYFDADDDGHRDRVDKRFLTRYLQPAIQFANRHRVPLAVTEFGAKRHCPGVHNYMNDLIGLFETQGWNYANWDYAADWVVKSRGMEETTFDLRYGPDPHSKGKAANRMQQAITKWWQHNQRRPSNTMFK